MNRHQESADRFRALAALSRNQAEASPLGNVHDAHGRSADRWEALAALEDMYIAHAAARLGQPPKWSGRLASTETVVSQIALAQAS